MKLTEFNVRRLKSGELSISAVAGKESIDEAFELMKAGTVEVTREARPITQCQQEQQIIDLAVKFAMDISTIQIAEIS